MSEKQADYLHFHHSLKDRRVFNVMLLTKKNFSPALLSKFASLKQCWVGRDLLWRRFFWDKVNQRDVKKVKHMRMPYPEEESFFVWDKSVYFSWLLC